MNFKLQRGTAVANTSSLSLLSSIFSDNIEKPGRIHEALGAGRGVNRVEGELDSAIGFAEVDGTIAAMDEVEGAGVEVPPADVLTEGVAEVEDSPSRDLLGGRGLKSLEVGRLSRAEVRSRSMTGRASVVVQAGTRGGIVEELVP